VEFFAEKLHSLKSAWMRFALGGMDAAVSTALGGVFRRKTPKLKNRMDAVFKLLTLRRFLV